MPNLLNSAPNCLPLPFTPPSWSPSRTPATPHSSPASPHQFFTKPCTNNKPLIIQKLAFHKQK